MILVIAEKPSVAQTIAAALGVKEKKDGYIKGSSTGNGAMTAYPFCRRNGNTPSPPTSGRSLPH